MRQCLHCQKDLPANAQFCSHCGTLVEDEPSQLAQPDETTGMANEQQEDAPQDGQGDLSETVPQLPVISIEQEESEPLQEQDSSNEGAMPDEAVSQPENASVPESQPAASIQQADASEAPHYQQTEPEIQAPEPPAQPAQEQAAETEQHAQIAEDENVTPLPPVTLEENDAMPREQAGKRRRSRALIAISILALIVIAGSAGTFVFTRGQTSASGSPNSSQCAGQQAGCAGNTPGSGGKDATHLMFSGAASGLMKVNASPRCQRAAVANLHTLTVTLTGVVGGQIYNFGFTIERYNGPGTYSSATTSTTVLFDIPGESTTNGWGNNSPAGSGTITIARGEQTGSISYLLHGFGTQSGTQIQVSGNWACE